MKLVEILARELKEWPGAIDAIVQRSTGVIYLYGSSDPIFRVHLADDWALTIVTIGEWEAERARIATNQQATQEAREIAQGDGKTFDNADEMVADLTAIACGKRSKEDQELWDRVALHLYIERVKLNKPDDGDVDLFECAFSGADTFMAERAKRMK